MIDEFSPDLSPLQADYQILTELRSSANSRTYLARHLKLNRDVTITVIRLANGEDPNTLTLFAADARTLSVMRHRNVVPVIEARWVVDGVFAIVRARVRGSTLDQLVEATGPMPVVRVASTLQQVHAAIEWARDNGIVHRYVAADAIVFQQGSGRVLIELDPLSLAGAGVPDACADARTIGRLSYEMLSGHREGDATALPLAEARPELSPQIVRETEELMRCGGDATSGDARALITLLGGKPDSEVATPPNARPSVPPPLSTEPIGPAVVVVRSRFGFNARLMTAVAVVAIIAVMGMLLLNRRGSSSKRSAASGQVAESSFAAGEVVLPPTRQDTTAAQSPPRSTPVTMPMAPPPTDPRNPASALPTFTPTTAADMCESPAADDQRSCLLGAIDRNDTELNAAYRRLIAAMRRQAGAQAGDPDPATVVELRDVEKRWVGARDAACRNVGERPLYARDRAECFAEESARRTRELQSMLATIP